MRETGFLKDFTYRTGLFLLLGLLIMSPAYGGDREQLQGFLHGGVPGEVGEAVELTLLGYDHESPDIRHFSVLYGGLFLRGIGEREVLQRTRDALTAGAPPFASFVALIGRQSAVYDSESGGLGANIVSPMLGRILNPKDNSEAEQLLREQYAEIIREIAIGRAILHFGRPRFLADGRVKTIGERPAKEVVLEWIRNPTASPTIAANFLGFLAVEYPRDQEIDDLLQSWTVGDSVAAKPIIRMSLLNSGTPLSPLRKSLLTKLMTAPMENFGDEIKGCASRLDVTLGSADSFMRPLSAFKRLF